MECTLSRHVSPPFALTLLCAVFLSLVCACDKLEPVGFDDLVNDALPDLAHDVSADVDSSDTPEEADETELPFVPEVIETECMGSFAQGAPGTRVLADLCDAIGEPVGQGTASVHQITDASELFQGPAARGQVGDWMVDTGVARFIIEGVDRHSIPCPYGGSPIDVSYFGESPTGTPDHLGEICFFMQLGRTVAPRSDADFEIVADGSDGGAAILAVTSHDTLSDWLNLEAFAKEYVGFLVNTPFSPEKDLHLTLTHYYIARPGDNYLSYLTAARNDGDRFQHVLGGDLIDSGGLGRFFNPASGLQGFGYLDMNPEQMEYLAFISDESSHAYVPGIRGLDDQGEVLPDATYLAISGAAAILLGTTDPIALLNKGPQALREPGVVKLEVGRSTVWSRRIYAGGADFSTITDELFALRGQATGHVKARVVDGAGLAVAGVPVAAVRVFSAVAGRTETRFVSDVDGWVEGDLPVGSYTLLPDANDRAAAAPVPFDLAAGDSLDLSLPVGEPGLIHFDVKNGIDDSPLPARVTILCDGTCPRPTNSKLRDVTFDGIGANVAAVFFIGVDGHMDWPIVPGTYRVLVSHGMTWSVYPLGTAGEGPNAGGEVVTVPEGGEAAVNAVLYKAVDTSEFLSADFHVHAVNSPDAPVANSERVLSFLGAGVDVLISTDHDFVTDYGPYVRALGAEGQLATMVGEELTTFTYGHFNAFPLQHAPNDRNGGAIDWAVDDGPAMHPRDIFAAFTANPGEQVIQVNHPQSGYFSAIYLDARTLTSHADPTLHRIAPAEPAPVTGDTGLFDEGFTAVEVYNGYSRNSFWGVMNSWFPMVAQGLVPTITATSDSHRVYSSLGGSPCTWVHVGAGRDTPSTMDAATFVSQTNANQAFGSNGPFVRLWATNAAGERVETAGLLASGGANHEVTIGVEVQTPLWMKVDTVTLYGNLVDTAPLPGEVNTTEPTSLEVASFTLTDADLLPSASPGAEPTRLLRYRKEVTFTVAPAADSYYVVTVEGKSAPSMVPVIWSNTQPFAFSNALLVDVDGGGYDKPPMTRAAGSGGGHPKATPQTRPLETREDWEALRRALIERLR
ncbi:MAG: hypothetical protein AUK47_15485 [Deltaproteobacteria bacterium CG2_30_63_29]|nr:MAG: hypothetical protein AUK47_15485 [Deltaproteobacteria bacterium CG2_30_63_29]PIV99078.1 MAG: hypothetical protein COW42_12200 [Deltaproteobacteria bacterium CG17_big_fil_post_rev_8_21_14_2_50_63_7]PJB43970.1 MAG: hypothetical protein CO108_09370 [Deltaproteobacteria bacterium CG_4_9_14_3_um_filter_63_12]